MSESPWIDVDPAKFNRKKTRVRDGVEVVVGMLPDDLPDGVRGFQDDELDRYVIEFRYLDNEEPHIIQSPDSRTEFVIGEFSGRLFAVRIDASTLAASIRSDVDKAIRDLIRAKRLKQNRQHRPNRQLDRRNRRNRQNYFVAGEVLKNTQEQLLAYD
ncbi:MAG: hypothetical protein O3A00_24860 [Planctomycetota bacterium]|nr:hypothetical protein [Planctomycetota bacterium]